MTELRNRPGNRRWRWAPCAVAAGVLTAVLPVSPAAAATGQVHVFSGEGLDAADDFNDVSTDGGITWTDAVIVPAQPPYSTISGTQWISSDANSGQDRPNSSTLFRRGFRLPAGITTSTGTLCLHSDNGVVATFNGTTVLVQGDPSDPENWSGDPSCVDLTNMAASGPNFFEFTVPNVDGPLGLDFDVHLEYSQDEDALPELTVPADITVAADSASGTVVSFQATAVDVNGFTVFPTCTPETNSLFAVGETAVTCSATGVNGTSTGTFTVTVEPFATTNLAPVLALPADIRLNASSTSGRTVTYSATATDDGAIPPVVTCVPPSGSQFRVGLTSVTCTATDDQQLSSSGSFTVTIVGPLERACAHLQEALGLTSKSRLVTVLNAAADNLQQARRGTDATTIRSLASKVKNSAYATIKPALRQTVLDTVRRVMARACCRPAPQA